MIKKHEYRSVIEELIVKYYDPHYEFKHRDYDKVFWNKDSQETAQEIHNSQISMHNSIKEEILR